jgi:hypothetical protein
MGIIMEHDPFGLEYSIPGPGHGMTGSVQTGLAVYYFLVLLLNLGFAAYYLFARKNPRQGLIWTLVGGIFLIHAGCPP